MRLFVAVTPSAAVLDRLEALVAGLRRGGGGRGGLRWSSREQWHVTLRFLGEMDDPAPVVRALEEADLVGAGRATLGPAVELLGRQVLCVPVSGLDALAAGVVTATASLGRPPDARPFRGHVTVARLRRPGDRREARSVVGTPVEGSWDVTAAQLVRSHLGSSGSRYEVLHSFSAR